MSRKLVVDDGRSARELLLVGNMIVGRDPECEISHKDPRLSRRHAEFTVGDDGVIVRDLDSRNGIRVNGAAATEAVLQPGDVVQIAQLTVRFIDGDMPADGEGASSPDPAAFGSSSSVAATVEDDRTRVMPSGAFVRSGHLATAAALAADAIGREDDRTRLAPGPRPVSAPRRRVPADLGDVVFREPAAAPLCVEAAELGIQTLVKGAWGRRVLMQGLLLAVVIFAMSTVPLLMWQMQTFGTSAAQSVVVLAPPLLAAAAAGVLVAALIARTAARGSRPER
jgi:predicted component of type VI protein secretion system